MCGLTNCDASLSCAGNGAFESTEGPADATIETDLAFLRQGANPVCYLMESGASKGTHPRLASQPSNLVSREGPKGSRLSPFQGNPREPSRDCDRSGELGSEFGRKFARHLYPRARVRLQPATIQDMEGAQ